MQYLLYFYEDKHIGIYNEGDVFFEKNYDLSQWKEMGDCEVRVMGMHGNELYEACVIFACDGADCGEIVKKLRFFAGQKHFSPANLIKLVKKRFYDGQRLHFPKFNVGAL